MARGIVVLRSGLQTTRLQEGVSVARKGSGRRVRGCHESSPFCLLSLVQKGYGSFCLYQIDRSQVVLDVLVGVALPERLRNGALVDDRPAARVGVLQGHFEESEGKVHVELPQFLPHASLENRHRPSLHAGCGTFKWCRRDVSNTQPSHYKWVFGSFWQWLATLFNRFAQRKQHIAALHNNARN